MQEVNALFFAFFEFELTEFVAHADAERPVGDQDGIGRDVIGGPDSGYLAYVFGKQIGCRQAYAGIFMIKLLAESEVIGQLLWPLALNGVNSRRVVAKTFQD